MANDVQRRAIGRALRYSHASAPNEDLARAEELGRGIIHELEDGAEDRAIDVLLTAMPSGAMHRYHTDPVFHNALKTFVMVMVSGVFGWSPAPRSSLSREQVVGLSVDPDLVMQLAKEL